jgi:hypothetical protein
MTDTNTTALNVTTDNDSQLLMDTLQSMDTVDSNVVKTVQEIMDKCAPKSKAKAKAKSKASQPSQSSHEPVITPTQQPVVVTLHQGQELHIHFDGNPKDSKILFI